MLIFRIADSCFKQTVYCKRRKFQDVVNFVVFADATIP